METITLLEPETITCLKKTINTKSIIINSLIAIAGPCLLLFVSVDRPDSTLNIVRLFGAWTLLIIAAIGFFARSRRWIHTKTGKAIKQFHAEFLAKDFDALHKLLKETPFATKIAIVGQNAVTIDCLYTDDKQFLAYQVLQHDMLDLKPLISVQFIEGAPARKFLDDIKKH